MRRHLTSLRESGFTLVELLVVLAIAGLMIGLVAPLLAGSYGRAQFRHAARDIATTLSEARSLAITHGRSEPFLAIVDRGEFAAGAGGRLHHLPNGMRMILITTTREVVRAHEGDIRFFSDGSSTGGGVRLIQGDREYDILVDWFTGRVSATCQGLYAC